MDIKEAQKNRRLILAAWARGVDHPCEKGHFGCSYKENGPCYDKQIDFLISAGKLSLADLHGETDYWGNPI